MLTSDSEDFESADEGHGAMEKKERKKRNSSSNYSENALENNSKEITTAAAVTTDSNSQVKVEKSCDGWDDFDIDEDTRSVGEAINIEKMSEKQLDNTVKDGESQDTGWDDFGDWGIDTVSIEKEAQKPTPRDKDIQEISDSLAATSTDSGGWGWGGWGNSLLNTATAGLSTITNQVSQGLSTVLETGMGIPDPEELARAAKDKENDTNEGNKEVHTPGVTEKEEIVDADACGDMSSAFGNILKFVGNTGSKVIAGGLDTLETIGRKTMEVLQDGDPGLAKKRAMLGFFDPDKPVLSQVLREAKSKAEEEDKIREEKREAKEVHYENLFDDFEGLVHLEALEMLSKQVSMRIEEKVHNASPSNRQEMKETLQQVAELCEMPDDEDDSEGEDEPSEDLSKTDSFLERLQKATQDLGVKLQFQPLVKQYSEVIAWLENPETELTEKNIYKRAISCLAQATALSVEIYHKAAEMLLVKPRRSTADEADGLTRLTAVLTKHMSDLATLFTAKMDSIATYENAAACNNYITNIFLEAGNSSTYIQNAFQLAQPIVQIGAV